MLAQQPESNWVPHCEREGEWTHAAKLARLLTYHHLSETDSHTKKTLMTFHYSSENLFLNLK